VASKKKQGLWSDGGKTWAHVCAWGAESLSTVFRIIYFWTDFFSFLPLLCKRGVCPSCLSQKTRSVSPEGSQQGGCESLGCAGDGTRVFPPSKLCCRVVGKLQQCIRESVIHCISPVSCVTLFGCGLERAPGLEPVAFSQARVPWIPLIS